MGALRELGFEVKSANALQRVIQEVGSSRPGAWLFSKTLYPQDKALLKFTGGRLTVPGLMAGLPVVMLTTTGAKTGKLRAMPLLGMLMGGFIFGWAKPIPVNFRALRSPKKDMLSITSGYKVPCARKLTFFIFFASALNTFTNVVCVHTI